MAEPISDTCINLMQHRADDVVYRYSVTGFGEHEVTLGMLLARIRAEQRRGDEEFNAGIQTCISVMQNDIDEELLDIMRALKRPTPTQEAPPHG